LRIEKTISYCARLGDNDSANKVGVLPANTSTKDGKVQTIISSERSMVAARSETELSPPRVVHLLTDCTQDLLRNRLQVCGRRRWCSSRPLSKWVRIAIWHVVLRPSICGGTNIKLTLPAAAALVPVSLIGRPVSHPWSASRRAVRKGSEARAHRSVEWIGWTRLGDLSHLLIIVTVLDHVCWGAGADPAPNGSVAAESGSPFINRVKRFVDPSRGSRRGTRKQRSLAMPGLIYADRGSQNLIAVALVDGWANAIEAAATLGCQSIRGVGRNLPALA